MATVLLITYHYPPCPTIGAQRPRALAKYLGRFGWTTVVLTPFLPSRIANPTVIQTGYEDVLGHWKRKLRLDPQRGLHEQFGLRETGSGPNSPPLHTRVMESIRALITYPDDTKGWVAFGVDALSEVNRKFHIDAILSTSPPISAHLIAARAKRKLACPWIADFRDLWSQNLALPGSLRLSAMLQSGLEKRTLAGADALLTVSEPWSARLRRRYSRKRVYTITNGFDPEDFANTRPQLTRLFTITYTGQLYEGRRNPTPLFDALSQLIADRSIARGDVRVRFYGPTEAWLPNLVEQFGLGGVVEIHGVVPREECLRRQAESQLLLLLGWGNPKENGQHTGKLFEYFGAERPIIAVGGAVSVLTETLRQTKAGIHALSLEQLRAALLAAYREFKTTRFVAYEGDFSALAQYTHPVIARQFAEVLNRVTEI